MENVKKKRKVKKNKKINYMGIIFVLVTVYFVYTFVEQQFSINKFNSQISMYKADIESKEKLLKYYSEKKNNIQTDEYIEQVARDVLGLVKPYETVFVDVSK